MAEASRSKKHPGGRPPKFTEPSRPVTVTLPERVLRQLAAIDSDRAKAITKLADYASNRDGAAPKPVALVKIAGGQALLLVGNNEHLKRLPWLRLVEVAPGRHLISIRPGTPIETIEVGLGDLLEDLQVKKDREREPIEKLLQIVRASRRTGETVKGEILFVAGNG